MKFLFLVVSLFFSASAFSVEIDNKDPFKLVQTVAKDLFERIAREQEIIKNDPEHLRVVVEEQLAPYINHVYAGSMVLGPYYRKVSEEERELFFTAFRKYLIATYAGILTLYKDQKVVFEPSSEVEGKRVQVKVRVLDDGRPDINIGFILRKNRSDEWSAYDMVAEGISVLTSKQKELQGQIRQQGIASVTEILLEKAAKPIVEKEL
ncbi:MAG: ABC transporter substrate-binding protein [Gammaproteobacteria bacterium]|nr:ABC transporter substrate-binding protein [Gammaproteobacteria bacterium]